jgi:hypothetical protein
VHLRAAGRRGGAGERTRRDEIAAPRTIVQLGAALVAAAGGSLYLDAREKLPES